MSDSWHYEYSDSDGNWTPYPPEESLQIQDDFAADILLLADATTMIYGFNDEPSRENCVVVTLEIEGCNEIIDGLVYNRPIN